MIHIPVHSSSESLRVVNSLQIVNSLRVLFLVCQGPFGDVITIYNSRTINSSNCKLAKPFNFPKGSSFLLCILATKQKENVAVVKVTFEEH